MKKILVFIKENIFDYIRPVWNIYNFFIWVLPTRFTLRLFGSVIHKTAQVKGKIRIYEPAWLQINQEAEVNDLFIGGPFFLFVDNNVKINNRNIKADTIITDKNIYEGNEIASSIVTLSFDFEKDKRSANCLLDILIKYQIPSVWAVCGYLLAPHRFAKGESGAGFSEKNIINKLKSYPDLFEIAYHSQKHTNYFSMSEEEIKKDMEFAEKLRGDFDLDFKSIIMPYNITAGIEHVLDAGFKNIRAYIGQYKQAKSLDFEDFKFFITSEFVSPKNVEKIIHETPNIVGKNFNYFTHPWNWQTEKDFKFFEEFLKTLKSLKNKINIKTFNDVRK